MRKNTFFYVVFPKVSLNGTCNFGVLVHQKNLDLMVTANNRARRRTSRTYLDSNEVVTVYHARMPMRDTVFPGNAKKMSQHYKARAIPRK
jgi:maleate cis-trans isomerase